MKSLMTFLCMTVLISHVQAATYEVPVAEDLKEFATFTLENFEKSLDGDTITVRYDLPNILTGVNEHISLQGAQVPEGSDLILFGDKGVAKCISATYSESVCSVAYFNLKFDEESAINSIKSISKSGVETLGRIEVMRAFSTDPVGIIKY